MKRLPIGIQSFAKLRRQGYLYVDKTAHLREIIHGGYYFLARPRRFGKSLLISTLEALFRGQREHFDGLTISADYDFPEHPVLRIDFSTINSKNPEALEKDLIAMLARFAQEQGVTISEDASLERAVGELIVGASRHAPMVILVDEYDRPFLDHLDNPDLAEANRKLMRGFYGVLKAMDEHIHLVFITGITRFSKVSLFSEMNNLLDLSIDPSQAALVGWTEEELDRTFGEHLDSLASRIACSRESLMAVMHDMYNGYRFTDEDIRVYNPWSVLNALHHRRIGNFWYDSGSPGFLMTLLRERMSKTDSVDLRQLYDYRIRADIFPTLDIRSANLEALMFQTGYLTVVETSGAAHDLFFHLGFPNREVELSWLHTILKTLVPDDVALREDNLDRLVGALREDDLDRFFEIMRQAFFANIPYELHLQHEKYYQTIFHTLFLLLRIRIRSEESTNIGRIDTVLETESHIYLFEFKMNEGAEAALTQIRDKGYAEKYLATGKAVVLVGVAFSERNIADWIRASP